MLDIFKHLRKENVNQKLLDYGLFSEKLTSIFSSQQFGVWVRKNGINSFKEKSFSTVKYRLTRNNNAPRIIEIPHPIAYFRLCDSIKANWSHILVRIGEIKDYEKRSMIIPKPNNLNKRLISMMTYDNRDDKKFLILDKSVNKKYFVHADIANCYHSIYSHSIAWALVGHQIAKDTSTDRTKWYNKFDVAIRSMQRNETVGIAIGPDTSSLISEIILSRIDKKLEKYQYLRFIDDYRCYCKSKEEADEFLRSLSRELEKYHLRLNSNKTKITELPVPIGESWVGALKNHSFEFFKKEEYTNDDITGICEFVDLAVKLSKENPSDSPLRYAARILSRKKFSGEKAFTFVIMYLSRICFIYPYFIDLFDKLIDHNKKYLTKDLLSIIENEINSLTKEHIRYSRSDVALWGIRLSIKHNFTLKYFEKYSTQLLKDGDCLPSLLCYEYAKQKGMKVDKYFNQVEKIIKEKLQDEWWIYIYELYRERPRKPAFKNILYKQFYEEMRKADITFIQKI